MITPTEQALLSAAIHDQEPVSGLTHGIYRYPARFSPAFVRAAIRSFSEHGDVVFDPFMGGGTTIVEASALGRCAVGTDVNSLAVFVTQAKTAVLSRSNVRNLRRWASQLLPRLNIHASLQRDMQWSEQGYQRNISSRSTWRIRKLLEIALVETAPLSDIEQQVARCVLLKTGQWAFDNRKYIPTASEFRAEFAKNADEVISAAREFSSAIAATRKKVDFKLSDPVLLNRSAVGVDTEPFFERCGPVRLVLTSPPYPGVHVLYHRWQVQGRRETPAPYWIANCLDGAGASYYTFGDRHQHNQTDYYERALEAFRSIANVSDRSTVVVQMIAFPEPQTQLPRYLEVMRAAGFDEVRFRKIATDDEGRIWRNVPNRKWYASQKGQIGSSSEVVLVHQLRH